ITMMMMMMMMTTMMMMISVSEGRWPVAFISLGDQMSEDIFCCLHHRQLLWVVNFSRVATIWVRWFEVDSKLPLLQGTGYTAPPLPSSIISYLILPNSH